MRGGPENMPLKQNDVIIGVGKSENIQKQLLIDECVEISMT